MTCREAGRIGGLSCRDAHDADYYRRIGRLTPIRSRAFYAAIGKLGAAAQRETLGVDGMTALSRRGGEATRARHGVALYARAGRAAHPRGAR